MSCWWIKTRVVNLGSIETNDGGYGLKNESSGIGLKLHWQSLMQVTRLTSHFRSRRTCGSGSTSSRASGALTRRPTTRSSTRPSGTATTRCASRPAVGAIYCSSRPWSKSTKRRATGDPSCSPSKVPLKIRLRVLEGYTFSGKIDEIIHLLIS